MIDIVLQILLALMFVISGYGKISESKMHVDIFVHLRLPQWFRSVTGLIEILGAISVLIGIWLKSWIVIGTFLLLCVAIGGIIAHLRVKDSFKQTFPILVFGVVSALLLLIYFGKITDFPY